MKRAAFCLCVLTIVAIATNKANAGTTYEVSWLVHAAASAYTAAVMPNEATSIIRSDDTDGDHLDNPVSSGTSVVLCSGSTYHESFDSNPNGDWVYDGEYGAIDYAWNVSQDDENMDAQNGVIDTNDDAEDLVISAGLQGGISYWDHVLIASLWPSDPSPTQNLSYYYYIYGGGPSALFFAEDLGDAASLAYRIGRGIGIPEDSYATWSVMNDERGWWGGGYFNYYDCNMLTSTQAYAFNQGYY